MNFLVRETINYVLCLSPVKTSEMKGAYHWKLFCTQGDCPSHALGIKAFSGYSSRTSPISVMQVTELTLSEHTEREL